VGLAVGPEAGTLEQHYERYPVGQGQFGHAIALGICCRANRPGQNGEILSGHHHWSAVNETRTNYHCVCWSVGATHECANLFERSVIDQVFDSTSGVELPSITVLAQTLRTAH
jgi:hypothetical protein